MLYYTGIEVKGQLLTRGGMGHTHTLTLGLCDGERSGPGRGRRGDWEKIAA